MKYLFTVLSVFAMVGICQADLLILGEESPPGEYLDANGKPSGVTIDLVNDMLHRLGETATIRILPWKRAYQMGLSGGGVALMETTRTQEREALFKWVGPILVVKRIIYAKAGYVRDLQSVEDVKDGGNICVLRGSSNERYLYSLGITNVDSVTKPAQCLRMLKSDRVKLFYTSEIGMNGLLKEQQLDPGLFEAVLNLKKEYLYLAFSKDVADARIKRWQSALEAAKGDGTLARIYHGVYSEETIKEIALPGDPLTAR